MVVALEPGRSSWTAPWDVQRLAPGADAATVTATQLRQLIGRLIAAGQCKPGDPEILIVADAGYDGPRLAWLLRDLPVQFLTRMRADRVLRRAAPPWVPRVHGGRKPRHGGESRMLKQTLGWTYPKTRGPHAADRWTWLILAAYTQLRLARPLAADRRRPWEKPAAPDRLTPARVRRAFRHLRNNTACPAAAPKPTRPGPGRPPGRRNLRPAPRHDVHIVTATTSVKTPTSKAKTRQPRPRRTA
jgi:hypothetical protein